MERRKFLLGVGSFAAAGAAAMGTGAFEGAYINGDRSMTVDLESDSGAYLSLIPTSPYASEEAVSGGWEGGQGVSQLQLTFDRLNPNMDSRFDDVFRIRNTTGAPVTLTIDDSPDWNGSFEDALQIFAQPSGGGSPTRLDDGGSVNLGSGQYVEINVIFLFGSEDPNGSTEPDTLTITADGTDSNA